VRGKASYLDALRSAAEKKGLSGKRLSDNIESLKGDSIKPHKLQWTVAHFVKREKAENVGRHSMKKSFAASGS